MNCFENNKIKTGFTIFELLIVVAILAVIGVVIISVFHNFRAPIILNSAAEEGISALSDARSRTLSSKGAKQYGVHFASTSITLFRGTAYSASDSDNEVSLLGSDVEISVINLNNGGQNVVFERLTGKTSNYGTTTFRLTGDISKTRDVVILPSGISALK